MPAFYFVSGFDALYWFNDRFLLSLQTNESVALSLKLNTFMRDAGGFAFHLMGNNASADS